jgi:hypothetical protein
MERTFTLDEAQSLLPVLESLLKKAIEGKQRLQEIAEESQELATRILLSGGFLVDMTAAKARKEREQRTLQGVKDAVSEIISIGVQVKDLDIGLLDFPCLVDGETILLCWKLGEEKIGYWHNLTEGFKGRKPIDKHITGSGEEPKQ